jgi:DNA helicase-2/ATP-dependent DNA helicase PcrA
MIEALRDATQSLPLSETVAHAIEASGLLAHYRQEKDGSERVENLEELVNAAQSFVREADLAVDAPIRLTDRAAAGAQPAPAVESSGRSVSSVAEADSPDAESAAAANERAIDVEAAASATPTDVEAAANEGATDPLTAFLAHAALEAGDTQAAEGRPALQLMTIHAAKGLEFHTVFVTGLEEGLFPHENSLNVMDGVEEERRLMYVAVTRARRRLYLTHAQSRMLHGQVRYGIASRFVDEIPRELLQWLSARDRRGAFDVDRSERGAGAWAKPAASVVGAPRATPPAPAWRIGQSVRHAKFGLGVIIDAEGRGSDARVQVNFRDAGVKWLALDYARLEAA